MNKWQIKNRQNKKIKQNCFELRYKIFVVVSSHSSSFHVRNKAKISKSLFFYLQCFLTQQSIEIRLTSIRLWKEHFLGHSFDCKWKRAKIKWNKNDFDICYFIGVNKKQRAKRQFSKVDEWIHPFFDFLITEERFK